MVSGLDFGHICVKRYQSVKISMNSVQSQALTLGCMIERLR